MTRPFPSSSHRSLPLLRRRTRVLFVLGLALIQIVVAAGGGGGGADEDDKANYLYFGHDNSFPVQEYRVVPGTAADIARHANFIYDPSSGPRIVEFYSPWCPHCQHFRDHYVQFAKQITTVARENGLEVSVHAVSCQVHRPLCHDFNVHSYPKVFLFAAGEHNVTKEVMYYKLHPFEVMNELGLHLDNLKLELGDEEQLSLPDKKEALTKGKKAKGKNADSDIARPKRTKVDVFDDAYLSLVFALKNGIYMSNGPLQGNATIGAFRDWLDLLQVALPPTWKVQLLVTALLEDFDNVTQSEANLVAVVDRFPPPNPQWSYSCTHGEPAMGYTCGLWQLFHIVTVGVVEWNLMIGSDDSSELVESIEKTALTIRNYIEHFFGCEVCRINFVSSFDSCAHDRCHRLKPDSSTIEDWSQLPVWLWETHNAVNVRLLREKHDRDGLGTPTRDEDIDKEWPRRDDCPACWGEGGSWNDLTIYKFLRTEYWPEDFVTTEYREELLGKAKNGDEDDDVFVLPPVAFQVLTLALIVGMAAAWYAKKVKRLRSGYHKKTDAFVPYSNGV